MTPMEALRASTILAADKLGFSPDLGSIEAGKLADFIVLDANPLEDIHNTVKIRWVVKNGEVWEAETMKKLWPREEPPPKFFWRSRPANDRRRRGRSEGLPEASACPSSFASIPASSSPASAGGAAMISRRRPRPSARSAEDARLSPACPS